MMTIMNTDYTNISLSQDKYLYFYYHHGDCIPLWRWSSIYSTYTCTIVLSRFYL